MCIKIMVQFFEDVKIKRTKEAIAEPNLLHLIGDEKSDM